MHGICRKRTPSRAPSRAPRARQFVFVDAMHQGALPPLPCGRSLPTRVLPQCHTLPHALLLLNRAPELPRSFSLSRSRSGRTRAEPPWPPVVLPWPRCARSLSFASVLLATPSTSPPCDASPASLLRLPPLPWAPPSVCPSRVPLLSVAMLPQAVVDHVVPLRVCAWAWASVCTAAHRRRPSPAGPLASSILNCDQGPRAKI